MSRKPHDRKMAPHYFDGSSSRWVVDLLDYLDEDQKFCTGKHREIDRTIVEEVGRSQGTSGCHRQGECPTGKQMSRKISKQAGLRQIGKDEGKIIPDVKGGNGQTSKQSLGNFKEHKKEKMSTSQEIAAINDKFPICGAEIQKVWETAKALRTANQELEALIPILTSES